MPAIRAVFKPLMCVLLGALSVPAISACEGEGEEDHDAEDSLDAPVEETAEPEPDERAEDPGTGDSSEETVDLDVPDAEEEELPCPTFSEGQPILTRACTGCHIGYDTYSAITSRLDAVRIRVEGFHHVFGEDRNAILRWIECGANP